MLPNYNNMGDVNSVNTLGIYQSITKVAFPTIICLFQLLHIYNW